MKRTLITGCGGMLGSAVYSFLNGKEYELLATDIDLNESWLSYLDVRDYEKSREIALGFKPELVLHLAALTSLEECEDNLENAYRTNFIGTRNMARICKEMDIPLVYISTAGVFDGKKDSYEEEDIPNPINIYGRTKYYGEVAVESMLDKYFIVRAGWMVGGGKKDKKFVSYILDQVRSGRKEFNVVSDSSGTPTYTRAFARNLEVLFNTDYYGKYHMACSGDTNRLKIAEFLLKNLGITDYKINPVPSSFFKDQFPVARAPCEKMLNLNLTRRGINLMGDWESALRDYLQNDWPELYEKK